MLDNVAQANRCRQIFDLQSIGNHAFDPDVASARLKKSQSLRGYQYVSRIRMT